MSEQQQKIVLAVVGSRNACDYATFETKLKKHIALLEAQGYVISLIVSGEAPGIDSMAIDFCAWNKYDYRGIPADWDGNGKAAGFIRNSEIVLAANVVIAFWDKQSPGTKDTIDKTLMAKKLLKISALPPFGADDRPYYPKTRQRLKATKAA